MKLANNMLSGAWLAWLLPILPLNAEDLQESLSVDVFQTEASRVMSQAADEMPTEAFLLYLAEIEVVRGDMLDPVALTKGLAKHSRENLPPVSKVSVKPETTELTNDEEAANE